MFSLLKRRRSQATISEQATLLKPQPPLEQRPHIVDAPYLLPKDAQENQRLNYQHYVLYKTLSNHFLAPIVPSTTRAILDVGTGTGIWPVEMSALFPAAHIIGIDLVLTSLPQPLPTTCLFSQVNILQGLPFPDAQFTFTHQRLMFAAIPTVQWPNVVRELARVTQAGGWIELLEIGDTIQNAGPATTRLLTWLTNISRDLGFETSILKHLGAFLQEAGCDSVVSQDIPVPLGEWAGKFGSMLKTNVLHAYNALKGTYCLRSQTPPEVFDTMMQAAADEWERNQTSYVFHAAYGRRCEQS